MEFRNAQSIPRLQEYCRVRINSYIDKIVESVDNLQRIDGLDLDELAFMITTYNKVIHYKYLLGLLSYFNGNIADDEELLDLWLEYLEGQN